MGLEKRGNHCYYYRKKRIGKKVRSKYFGTGEIARTFARCDELIKQRDLLEQLARNYERDFENEMDAEIDEFSALVSDLTTAFLLVNGFHQHKRQWRRKRK